MGFVGPRLEPPDAVASSADHEHELPLEMARFADAAAERPCRSHHPRLGRGDLRRGGAAGGGVAVATGFRRGESLHLGVLRERVLVYYVEQDDAPADTTDAAATLATFISNLTHLGGLASTLRERNVPAERLPELATAATEQWTGTFNPIELTKYDYQRLYEAAL